MVLYFRSLFITFCLMLIGVTSSYAQGAGIMIGEPTGFSFKMWHDDVIAYDAGLAWSFSDNTDISVHGDVLWHNWQVLADAFEITHGAELPLYYGIGGRLKAGVDSRFGIRFVVGASFMPDDEPLDIFIELAPIMDIAPDTTFRAHMALGCRYWF